MRLKALLGVMPRELGARLTSLHPRVKRRKVKVVWTDHQPLRPAGA